MVRYGVKNRIFRMAVFAVLLSVFSGLGAALAETRYVSDTLIVSLREGQDEESPSIGYIKSDTPVEVIEENDEFVLVRTPEDLTGWIKKRFLVSETPKSLIIEQQKQRINDLEDKVTLLQQNPNAAENTADIQALRSRIDELQTGLTDEKNQVSKLENLLAKANVSYQKLLDQQKQSPQDQEALQALKQQNSELVSALEQARQNASPSLFAGNVKWFLSGAGVLLLGFIIGRSLRRQRTYRY